MKRKKKAKKGKIFKKTKKKKAKIKRKIKKNKKTSINSVNRKDFETFQFGVQRLKELEKELKSLNTKNFPVETASIKSKLKNVSQIPVVEKEMKKLKTKISGRYKPKRRKNQSKKLMREIIKIKEENIPQVRKSIRRDINEIKEKHIPRIRRSIKKDMDEIKEDIPRIRNSIKKSIGKDIIEIKEDTDDIPELKQELSSLNLKIKNMQKKNRKIDPAVGILVDTDFNEFLSDIKASLSERIKTREKKVDDILKTDLQKRESKFREKYINMVRDFNEKKRKMEYDLSKKYNATVKSSLQKEVSEKFNDILGKKLDAEKVGLGKKYKASLKEHADLELEKQKQRLKSQLENEFRKKFNLLKREKQELSIKEQRDKNILEKKEQENKDILEKKKKEIKNKLVDDFHNQLEKELSKKEKDLRNQLKNDFELKLKKEIYEHEQNMKKRKINLEMEMQKKIKQMLRQ